MLFGCWFLCTLLPISPADLCPIVKVRFRLCHSPSRPACIHQNGVKVNLYTRSTYVLFFTVKYVHFVYLSNTAFCCFFSSSFFFVSFRCLLERLLRQRQCWCRGWLSPLRPSWPPAKAVSMGVQRHVMYDARDHSSATSFVVWEHCFFLLLLSFRS